MFKDPFAPIPPDTRTIEEKAEALHEYFHYLTARDWLNAIKESDGDSTKAFSWLMRRGLSG